MKAPSLSLSPTSIMNRSPLAWSVAFARSSGGWALTRTRATSTSSSSSHDLPNVVLVGGLRRLHLFFLAIITSTIIKRRYHIKPVKLSFRVPVLLPRSSDHASMTLPSYPDAAANPVSGLSPQSTPSNQNDSNSAAPLILVEATTAQHLAVRAAIFRDHEPWRRRRSEQDFWIAEETMTGAKLAERRAW